MPSFKDQNGREWSISLNLSLASRLKTEAGVDVFTLYTDGLKGLADLLTDPVRLAGALYVVCSEQCQKNSLSAEQFGAGLAGDSLADAGEAFSRAAVDFFPNRAARPVLAELLTKTSAMKDLAAKASMENLAKVSPEAMLETWKKTAGNGAESSEPTPEPSPQDSSP